MWAAPLALLLAAAALRFRNLDAQSLWLDEGMTVSFINLGLERLWEITFAREPNPPLYYFLLWGWVQLWGQSEGALRGLSAVFGVLTVLPVYGLARDSAGTRAGLLAGAITLASPFLLWYSQEARAFALLGLLSATLLYLTYSAQARRPSAALLASWGLCAALTCYTHIYGAFTVAACALALLVAGRGPLRWRLVSVLVPAALYAPWVIATLLQSAAARGWRAPVGPDEMLGRALAAVVHHEVLDGWIGIAAVLGLGGAAVLGLATTDRRTALLLGLAIAVPLAAAYGLSFFKPIFAERYVIPIAPPLFVAAAIGILSAARWFRPLPALAALGLVGLLAASLFAFEQPRFAKENFRAAAAHVAERADPDDVVLFVAEFSQHPFRYYYRGQGELIGFFGDHRDPGPFLAPIIARAGVVWLVESHWERYDSDHRVRGWLQDRYPLATEAYPQGIHLRAFRVRHTLDAPPAPRQPVDARFGPLQLLGVEFPSVTPARDEALHPPSAWLPVTLYWQAVEPPTADYQILLELVDGRGVWGRSLRREGDLFAKLPTSTWRPGPTMIEEADLNLNPATPPGRYLLQLAVLDARGQPVAGRGAQGEATGPWTLGEVEVRP